VSWTGVYIIAANMDISGLSEDVVIKRPIEKTVKDFLGGLRITCTYVGAVTLENLPKCTTFVRI
jgi:GMP reductase